VARLHRDPPVPNGAAPAFSGAQLPLLAVPRSAFDNVVNAQFWKVPSSCHIDVT
jgi:hypothetical protein